MEIKNELKDRSIRDFLVLNSFFRHKYPRLFLLAFAIVLAYVLFQNDVVASWVLGLENYSYLGIFIGGILLAFGFTAPFAVGFFIFVQPENILLATFVGGLGAVFSDLVIYEGIHSSFTKEFNRLKKTRLIKGIKGILNDNLPRKAVVYLMYAFAGIMIATPLPDEIGVSMIAGLTTVKRWALTLISFVLHTTAIYLLIVFSVNL